MDIVVPQQLPRLWVYSTVLSLLLLGRALFNRYRKRANHIPGPFLNSITILPRLWSVFRSKSHVLDLQLHRKYGTVVRLAPKVVSVSDISSINQLYGVTTKFVKSDFFKLGAFTDETGAYIDDPFSTQNRAVHSRLKRGAANAYSLTNVIRMQTFIHPVITHLLEILDRYAEAKAVCNIGDILKNYAMDAIFAVTFGQDQNYLERGDHLRLYYVLDIFTDYMAIFGQIPWIHKYLLKNPRLNAWVAGNATSQIEMMGLAMRETKHSFEKPPSDDPKTFVQVLVGNQQKNADTITLDEIYGNALGNITAGSHTTAIALRATLFHVLMNRRAYDRLCEDIRLDLTTPVEYHSASKLAYLTACIKEAMRMHPSVGMLLGRQAPKGGAVVCGHYIGEGIEIGINPVVIHYDSEVFPDPHTFRPERWLDSTEEHLKVMDKCLITFGHGHHSCSGRHISMVEITNLIPTLFLR